MVSSAGTFIDNSLRMSFVQDKLSRMSFSICGSSFTSTGYVLGADTNEQVNYSNRKYVSWTFREAAKFFDIVTYTGTGSARTIAHNLGSVPGCIIVKTLSTSNQWSVYHRSLGASQAIMLQSTNAAYSDTIWNNTTPTSTVFSLNSQSDVNASGVTYVAYLFAHDTAADGIIQCGSYTGNGSATGPVVTLGWEPQYVMVKNATTNGYSWGLFDSMRGMPVGSNDSILYANDASAEVNNQGACLAPNATGFSLESASSICNSSGDTYIYMAIRMPNKPPTTGTQVYNGIARTGNSPTVTSITSVGFAPDAVWEKRRSPDTANSNFFDKLRGRYFLSSASTSAETAANTSSARDLVSFDNLGFTVGEQWSSEINANTKPEVYWNFKRAPGFFDEVCYTGTGSALTVNHNLGVVPEMMVFKTRTGATRNWGVYTSSVGTEKKLWLNTTNAVQNDSFFVTSTPTSTVLNQGIADETNESGNTYVAYLFATLAGISKVGSYTGNGSTGQAIACGFSAGARFVLIKRTDSTGDWYTFDSARGLTVGSSPYLLLNSTAAEVTGNNGVYASTGGFTLATSAAGLNASGGTYIFLAVA